MGRMHEYAACSIGATRPTLSRTSTTARIEAMRGKVLGGSSSINVMAYTRGNPGDYDRWAQKGARGWSYADVLPYFRRCETWQGGEDTWRGGAGPLGTEFARTQDPLYEAWLAAAKACGYPLTSDYNGKQQEGFGRGQYTIRDGRRSSSAKAFLKPALGRKNLTVATNAHTTRVTLDGTRARRASNTFRRVNLARRRDARGDPRSRHFQHAATLDAVRHRAGGHLRSFGIDVVADLPVGKNLQDHLGAYMTYSRRQPGTFHREMRFDRMAVSMVRAYLFGTRAGHGGAGRPACLHQDAARTLGARHRVHVPWHVARPRICGSRSSARLSSDGFGIRPTLLHPDSRGELLLRFADPIRARRVSSIVFSPRRTICRRCAKDLNGRASLRSTKRSIPIAARKSVRDRGSKPTPRSTTG